MIMRKANNMTNVKKWLLIAYCTMLTCLVSNSESSPVFPSLDHIRTSTPPGVQVETVMELIQRVLGPRAKDFAVYVNPTIGPKDKDTFQLLTDKSGRLMVTGTSGVAAAMGFHYYLTQYCKCHVAWEGAQLNLPSPLPAIARPLKIVSNDRFRYYQNVCTVSYSFVWWDWARWEREIDWMAMNGINLPLAFNGQEAIWRRVFLRMGFYEAELTNFFGGPAFLAWARMGNMHGWGGPLTLNWHSQQLTLQHQILQRMRNFGIIPVLPAFAGFVPETFGRVFPLAKTSKMADWGGFNSTYCCELLLDVADPLFQFIGKAFLSEYISEFGTDHVYNTDTFNEMSPASGDPAYLAAASKAVYKGMTVADPDAIWLMQGWLFQSAFWTPDRARALLTAIPQGRMIILDLFAENWPIWLRFDSFYGQPFIWCMLHNFGGTSAMYGVLDNVNKLPFDARAYKNSTMIGTGLTMEGINQNYVMYEFMNENAWRTTPRNLTQWISDYALRRYGVYNSDADAAWQLLKQSVYNCTNGMADMSGDVIVVRRPRLDPSLQPQVWYRPEDLFTAWDYMLKAAISPSRLYNNPLFRYDLVDVTRQSLQVIAIHYYNGIVNSYKSNNVTAMSANATALLSLLWDLDIVLSTDEHFLLGRWLESAKILATNDFESQLYEYNARNQLTLWGPSANILDYANKQWAGLVKYYYLPRWTLFVHQLTDALTKGQTFDQSKFNVDVFETVEKPFTFDRTLLPNTTQGDTVIACTTVHMAFRPITREEKELFANIPIDNNQKLFRKSIFDGVSGQKYYEEAEPSPKTFFNHVQFWRSANDILK